MTDEEAGLVRAVLEQADDDTPRLVFADWMDDNAGAAPCRTCDGSGRRREPTFGQAPDTCPHCGGRTDRTFVDFSAVRCRDCWAVSKGRHEGWQDLGHCPACSGAGEVPDGRHERAEFVRLQVEIARLSELVLGSLFRRAAPGDADNLERMRGLKFREREMLGLPQTTVGPPKFVCSREGLWWWNGGPREDSRTVPGWLFQHPRPTLPSVGIATLVRGWVGALEVTAAVFTAEVAGFAWSPEWTDPCESCWGSGRVPASDRGDVHVSRVCPDCDRGEVRRHYLVGAQPVRSVDLTAVRGVSYSEGWSPGGAYTGCVPGRRRRPIPPEENRANSHLAELYRAEWPGVKFRVSG